MSAPTLQFKRGLLANLPGLQAGEPGFTTDSYELYVGINSTTQENKFFGSHRYWNRETVSTGSGVNFVEGTSNGTDFITIKSPGTLAGIVTFILPSSDGTDGQVLKTNGSGVLSFFSQSASAVFTGISTFSDTTDNTLGNENTGAVQIDGGVGIAKNLTVKENLHVGGYAEFVGVVTFKGGTINLGDGNTDDINVGGEFISGLVPNVDDAHDLGSAAQRWRTLNVVSIATTNINASGIVTATTFIGALTGTASTTTNIPNLTGAITSVNTTTSLGSFSSSNLSTALTDETGSGVAVFATSPTLVTPVLGDATATTIVTSGAVNVGTALSAPTVKAATIQHSNATNAATIDASGNITAAQNLTISGNLFVNGSTTQVNTAAITVEDRTIELGVVDGAAPTSATTWDLGVLFNYHATTAKKSAVIWEHGDARFKFASLLGADTDGNSSSTPQLTVTTFAPIEIGSLFVNDCAGASQVISCTGTTRFLENITIDCGTF